MTANSKVGKVASIQFVDDTNEVLNFGAGVLR